MCARWASGERWLTTGAWRNPSADKTPKPELIHIKESTLTQRRRRSFFVLSLTVHRGFYLLIINGPGAFTPRHHHRSRFFFSLARVGRRSTGGRPQVTRRRKLQR